MLNHFYRSTKSIWILPKSKFHFSLITRNSLSDFSSRSRTALGSFPLIRLVFQVVYRVARPFANEMVLRAQKNVIFREYLCIPLGRAIHWMDIKVRMRILNLGKLNLVPKIDDKKAMDLGAQLLLEVIVIIIFSVIVIYQYNESVEKEEKKDEKRKEHFKEVEENINEIEQAVNDSNSQIKEVQNLLNSIRPLVT